MAAMGATVLFVPTSKALPKDRTDSGLRQEARAADLARAVENHAWVIRADVAGDNGRLMSHGTSGIADPTGRVVLEAQSGGPDLLVVDLTEARRAARLGPNR